MDIEKLLSNSCELSNLTNELSEYYIDPVTFHAVLVAVELSESNDENRLPLAGCLLALS